jgi:hypothetical protein
MRIADHGPTSTGDDTERRISREGRDQQSSRSAISVTESEQPNADYVRPGLPRRGGLAECRLSVIAPFRV